MQVGVGIVIFGLFQSASSYLAGKFAERFGRNLPMLFGFVLDAAIYVFCLLWKPTEGTTYFVYILFAAFGISLGILLPLTNGKKIEKTKTLKTDKGIIFTKLCQTSSRLFS